MITKFTKAYTRHYRDNGQTTTYVEWINDKGRAGRTEGEGNPKPGSHMLALVMAAARHGVKLEQQTW